MYEHVIVAFDDLPIRSNQETSQEVVQLLRGCFRYVVADSKHVAATHLPLGLFRHTVTPVQRGLQTGFYHGFDISQNRTREDGPVVIQVAKILQPQYVHVRENRFIMPENIYGGNTFPWKIR